MGGSVALGYVAADSIFHRADPITKFIGLVGIIVFAVGAPISYNVAMLVGLLLLVPLTKVDFKTFLRPWKVIIPLWIPFIILPPILFNLQSGLMGLHQTASLTIGRWSIPYSVYGLNYGLKIAARGTVIGVASLIVLWTTHPRVMVQAVVQELKAPYKYAWSTFLALVYVPIVEYEARMRGYALKVRGIQYRRMSLHGLQVFAIPVVLRSLRRGFSTALSMEARGFGIAKTRTFRYPIVYPKRVWLIRTVLILVLGGLVFLAGHSGHFTVFVNPS